MAINFEPISAFLLRMRTLMQLKPSDVPVNTDQFSSSIDVNDQDEKFSNDEVSSEDESSFEQSIESDTQQQRYADDSYRRY